MVVDISKGLIESIVLGKYCDILNCLNFYFQYFLATLSGQGFLEENVLNIFIV